MATLAAILRQCFCMSMYELEHAKAHMHKAVLHPPPMQLPLSTILSPAIELAECGFPVGPVASLHWDRCLNQLVRPGNTHGKDLLYQGERAPAPGEIMQMPHLANTLKVNDREC